MTTILLVRHGHVEGIAPERFRGRVDLPLTEKGRREAEMTARHIHTRWHPAAIYSSPLARCRATAAAIGGPFALAPTFLDGLLDIDYGAWQGLTPDEVRQRWPEQLERWYHAPDQASIPQGETLREVRGRAAAALEAVRVAHPDDTVVIVAHDSVNRAILLHALGAPLAHYWRIRQTPCAINEIDMGPEGFCIASINETAHLSAPP